MAYVQRPVYDLHPEHLIRPDVKIDGKLAFVGRMGKKGSYQPTVFTEDNIGAPRRKQDLFDTWQAAIDGKTDELHHAICILDHIVILGKSSYIPKTEPTGEVDGLDRTGKGPPGST